MSTQPPEGVRLVLGDGTVVPCNVTRAPLLDRKRSKGTVEYYLATPSTVIDPALSYDLEFDKLYPMTGLDVDFGQDGDLVKAMPPSD